MNREEIRKKWKNKEFVEITNSKPNLSSNERNYVKPISNDMWSNVMNRANQMLSNTTVNIKNTNNLVKVEKPLLNASKIYTITEEQAKNIANIEDSKKRFEEISRISNNRQQYQQNAIKVNQIRETEKNKKKAEKINQDIKEGNYLSSLGHVLSGLPKEAMNAVTKTTLSLANLNPNTKDSKEMMEAGKILTSNYSDTTSQIDNKIIQGASRVSGTIGNMIPSIATNLMGGPAGLVNAINAGTSSYMENLNEEQNNKLKSTLTGLGKGTLSYYIEKLSGGNFLGKGSLDDLAKQGILKIKSDVGKKIASKVYEVGGEIAEENLENITGYVVDKLINDKDITMEQFVSDLKQTTGDTAITTLVLSALGLGGNTYQEIKAMELNQQQDLINNSGLSDFQKQKLEEVAQKYDLSEKDIQDLIDNTKNGKYTENQATTMQNNEVINQNKQVILPQDKTAQNSVSQQNNTNNEYKAILPGSNYKFEASGNQKIDNLRQDANKYYNNSKKARDLISSMEKIIADKDYSIRLDNTITDARGNFVNGKITKENGETIITINPDSNRAFEFIIGHEVGHAITTPEMKKLVIDFASKNKEFSKSIESLKQTYNTNEITDEVISDIEGQLLGNQDFINSLSLEKPSIFKQIYDVIISIANKITGNSNEALFIRDLKNKYQKAYREIQGSNVIEGKESYSKETTSDGIEYIKSEQNLFTKEDGSAMTPIEAYNSLVGKTIDLGDGDSAYILKRLPGKNLYDELFKRYPKFLKNISDAKKLNADVNNNIVELLENSKNINPNEPDVLNRHIKQGITNFDTRIVNFYDGNNAYQIEFSIAKLNDGKKVAYAKKFFGLDKDLTQKIKVDEAMGNKSQLNQQPLLNNSIPSSNEKVNTTEYSMQESENNSGSFSFDEKAKRYEDLKLSNTINYNKRSNGMFNIEILNDKELINQITIASKEDAIKQLGNNIGGYIFENAKENIQALNLKQQDKNDYKPFTHKEKQLDIIKKTNPMLDDYHVGIRKIEDIKTFEEAIQDEESFSWGDYSKEDAERDLKRNKVRVYSSYSIKNGTFVSTSYEQALEYAGMDRSKVYSKEINPSEVAWINGDEGQYANVENKSNKEKYSKPNETWQEYLESNFKAEGTRTYKEDVRLPEQKQVNLPTIDNTQEKSKYTPTTKSMNYERKQRNIFKKNMSNMLGISQFNQNNKGLFDVALNQLKSEYNQRGSVSEEVRNDIFNNLYNNLLKEDRAFYDENKEIKDNIRTTKLYVDNKTKTSIVDYDDFRKSTMGSAILTNDDTNMPIDSYYKELNELNPGLFPDNITNTADQLQRIVEVSKSIRKSERNIAEYADEYMSKEYRQYAKQEFDLYVNQLLKEYKIVDRYNQDKIAQNQKEDYVAPDLQEIRTFYENRNALQKEIEKQERNLLLTQREKAVVDRLLKDEMDVNEILPGLNKDAILKSYTARQQLDYLKQEIKKYKSNVKQNLKDIADSLIIDAENWKDKSWGGFYSRETATRNMQDIMSRDSADRINKELFEPIIHNTAEQTRFLNEYTDIINKLNLDKKEKYDWRDSANKPIKIDEATVAQLLIEKKISDEYLKSNNMNVERIHNIADTFEKLLKDTVNRMDDVYVRFGYAPVEKRKNYFPHFLENQPDTFMSKFANAFGFKVGQDDLPTDIAGRTETFKPGRAFDRNILQRTTDKTDYNALKALDMYMQGASDIIYHTEDIQKLRAFNESIRDRFRTSEIQKKLDAINENVELTEEERFSERQKILEGQKTPLNNLVTWIDEYTNVLANKKSSADRQLEKDTSRQAYTTMKDIEGKISSNLIGGNFSVALTNFAPLSQAMGTTKVGDILIGMIQTTQNSIDEMIKGQGDGFVNESDFLTSRRGNDLAQKERLSQQLSNVVSKPMEIIDNFTSEAIVRAKYRENIKNGMDHNEALKNADNYARNLMADRSKGAMPIYFNRTNPATKLISAFQIEPNNIISNYFKDMPRDAKINKQNLAFQITKLSVASYAFNTILKSIRGGGDVIPNPIGIVSQLIELAMSNLDDDDDNDKEVKEVLGNIANDILGNIPGGSALASLGVALGVDELQDNGKLMVSSAMPDFTKVANLFDSSVSNDYKKQVIANELTKPLLYLGLPTGGAQLSKTAKGLYSYVQGASYSYDKDGNKSIQFPVEQTPKNLVQSSIFGKYATDSGKEYVKEFNGMNYKETAVYDKSNIDFNKLKDYFNYSKTKEITKSDKFDYIKTNMANISTEDKWNLFEYNILSSDERDDGTSQVTDAEYAIKNKMATQKEYMNLYEKAEKNNIEFPNGEKLKELKENNLELETYIKYKINLKQEGIQKEKQFENQQKSMLPISEEDRIKSKSLNNTDKINIIKHKIYTEEEKDKIYINEIGKDDDVYTSLKLLNNGGTDRINDYLDYKTADLSSDKKDDGTLKGKTISGSAEAKFKKYIYSSNFRDIEKTYLYGTKYKLDSSQRSALENYIKELDITSEEKNNIYKSLASSNIVEMKDGTIKWKN